MTSDRVGGEAKEVQRVLYCTERLKPTLPVIPLKNKLFKNNEAKMMLIDTGSDINLVKQRVLAPGITINRNIVIHIIVVGECMQKTMGEVELEFGGIIYKFHVVSNSFSVNQGGIVGLPFLCKNKAIIDFSKPANEGITLSNNKCIPFRKFCEIQVPARTRKLVSLPIQKADLPEGYLRRIDAGPGIFMGHAIVVNG